MNLAAQLREVLNNWFASFIANESLAQILVTAIMIIFG